MVIEADAWLNT